jgi:serine/threonine protein kinase
MNSIKDEFLHQYGHEVLSAIALPEKITEQYSLEACFKYTQEKRIYLLCSRLSGENCILKQTSRLSKENLQDEYIMLSFLDDPAFPHAIDYMEDEEYSYLIREYIPGSSLYDIVGRQRVFTEGRTMEAAIAICKSLNYLHHQKPPVIHRDIKPQNIILTPQGEYHLVDMGTSRLYKDTVTQDTIFMGTQVTAAPEQFGYGQTDERSDIYGLGMLMVFLLTGGFDITSAEMRAVAKPLRHIITKCLAFDPSRRYSNAAVLKSKLEHCWKRQAIRIRLWASLSICAVLLAVGVGIWWVVSRPDPAQVVHFQSPLIEQAVKRELGKADNEPILQAELDEVTQVLICGEIIFNDWNRYRQYAQEYYINDQRVKSQGSITGLEDLKLLRNLNTLVLDNQDIRDISQLKGLPLKKLNLCGNKIYDLSPLKECRSLTTVKLENNPFKDIRPLAELKRLDVLDIGGSNVSSIAPLKDLPIRELYMIETKVEDYAPLQQLPELEKYAVRYLPPKGLKIVRELTSLKSLTIYNSGIEDLNVFEKLTNLQELDLNSNALYDLSGVQKLDKLRHIGLGQNRIKSLAPIAALSNLLSIDITDSDVSDISILMNLPNLRRVYCDQEQAAVIRKSSVQVPFEMMIQQ